MLIQLAWKVALAAVLGFKFSCQCLQLWFTSVLRDGIATGTIGAFAPFKEIGTYHLHRMLAEAAVPGDHTQAVQTVLSGFDDATCLSDVEPAFKQLHAKGILVSIRSSNVCKQGVSLDYRVVSFNSIAVGRACTAMQEACLQISTMTNGSIAITKGLLQRAQLEQYVDLVMDISQPKAWKPSSAAYSYAVKQLKLQPEQVGPCIAVLLAWPQC